MRLRICLKGLERISIYPYYTVGYGYYLPSGISHACLLRYKNSLQKAFLVVAVLLQNIIIKVFQHHRVDPCPDHGHVLLFLSAPHANEHAPGVPHYHNPGPGRPAVQLLSQMV